MISSVTSSTTSTSTATSVSETESLGKDDFLNLLVTQLKNQDPLNPLDSADFTAQLAQFSSLEELENANTNLETLVSAQTSMINNQAISYIGKNVMAYGNITQVEEGVPDEINFEIDGDAEKTYIQIYNSDNELIRNIEAGSMDSGKNTYTWDGLDENGNQVADGTYTFEAYAYDANDTQLDTVWYYEKPITGVTYNGGSVYLNSGDLIISADAIFKVLGS